MRPFLTRMFSVLTLSVIATAPTLAQDYYNEKWFDYPDGPSKLVDGDCHEWVEFLGTKTCVSRDAPHIELQRRDARVVVSGPDTAEQAIQNAIVGYTAGCVVAAIGASVAGPQVVVAPAGFYATFMTCISNISMDGVVGGVLKQLEIKLDTSSTHWSPL